MTTLQEISTKLDSDVAERLKFQEYTIKKLLEQSRVLTAERNTQQGVILLLKKSNAVLRTHLIDIAGKNDDIKSVTQVFINIANNLKQRPDESLSNEEREIVKSAEQANMLFHCIQDITGTIQEISYSVEELNNQVKPFSNEPAANNGITIIKKNSRRKSMTQKFSAQHPNIRTLLRFPLFAGFPNDVMEEVSLASYEIRRRCGQTIIKKGDEAAEMFFLIEGVVAIIVDDEELSQLEPPAFFGELGVLFKFRRTASVVAKVDSTMVVVTKEKLDLIINNKPELKASVEFFSSNKETWWQKQQYVSEQEKFGAEFAFDIARKDIKRLEIFSLAPDAFVNELVLCIKCLVYQPNEKIVSIGEESDAIYFILSGCVEVVGNTGVVHAEIAAGSFFGEVGVLLNMKRNASIRAKDKSSLFKLTKEDLDRAITHFPSVKSAIKLVADERYELIQGRTAPSDSKESVVPDQFDMEVAGQSLSKLALFSDISQQVLAELGLKMTRKTWLAGESIIRCGDVGGSMFFLAAGDVVVLTEFGEIIDNASGPSAYFGEVALIENVPRTASVKCKSTCSSYELRKNDFTAVLEKYPPLAKRIKETAEERMQNYLMRSILA